MSAQKKPLNALQAVLDQQVSAQETLFEEPSSPTASSRTKRQSQKAPRARVVPASVSSPHHRPSRTGKRLIGGHFSPDIAKHLKILAAEEDTSVQALLEEALDLLFVKKGKGHIGRA